MKANTLFEVFLLSTIMLTLGVGGFYAFQATMPEAFNQITGMVTVGATVNVTPVPPVNCAFTLENNLNLVSLFCIGDFESVTNVFGSLTNLVGVFSYDKTSSDEWKAYKTNLPAYAVNDLQSLTKRKGYWVKMNASETFFFEGFLTNSTSISLTSGYDLSGYPTNKTQNTQDALASINGSYSKVVGFDPVSQTFLVYVPNGTGNTLNQTEVNKAFWINMTTSDTLVIS